ncbi:hypothetical protein GCM10009593_29310 [Microlunatus antarcticus]
MLASLVSCSDDVVDVGTLALEPADVTVVPAGFFAVTVAVLATVPASTSAWLTV